jgi:hypothetical protein
MSAKARRQRAAAQRAASITQGLSGLDSALQGQAESGLGQGVQTNEPSVVSESVNVADGPNELGAAPTDFTDTDVLKALADGLTASMKGVGDFSITADTLKQLGYNDASIAELTNTIGQSPIGMTADQLKAAVENAANRVTAEAETEQAISQDVSLGRNAREAAEAAARESEQAVAADASEIDRTIESMQDAGTIDFFGQKLTVEQLLNSDKVMPLITDYITGDEDTKAKLREQSPELAAWLDENATVVREALKAQDDAEKQQYDTDVRNNQWVSALQNVPGMSDAVKQQVFDMAQKYPAAQEFLNDPTGVGLTFLTEFQDQPEFIKRVLDGTFGDPEDLRAMGLFDIENLKSSDFKSNLKNYASSYAAVNSLIADGKPNSPQEVIDALFPEGLTFDDVAAMLKNPQAFEGDPLLAWAQTIFDRDKDGKINSKISKMDLFTFQQKLTESFKSKGAHVSTLNTDLAGAMKIHPDMKKHAALLGDKKITTEEAPTIINLINTSGLSSTDMQSALQPYMSDPDGAVMILSALGKKAQDEVYGVVDKLFPLPNGVVRGINTVTSNQLFPPEGMDPNSPEADYLVTSWGETFQDQENNLKSARAALRQAFNKAPKGSPLRLQLSKALANVDVFLDKLGNIPEEAMDQAPPTPEQIKDPRAWGGSLFTPEGWLKNQAGEAGQGFYQGGADYAFDIGESIATGDAEGLAQNLLPTNQSAYGKEVGGKAVSSSKEVGGKAVSTGKKEVTKMFGG